MDVPYLDRDEIRAAARELRDSAFGKPVTVPVDIEGLVFDYLYPEHGVAFFNDQPLDAEGRQGVLGVTYPFQNEIHVDEQLADEGHTGRYRFTVAHEIGHWVLHRPLFVDGQRAREATGRGGDEPSLVTLERDVFGREDDDGGEPDYRPEEWQANVFAIWLLLPDDPLRREFEHRFGEPPFVPPPVARDPDRESPIRPASLALAATAKHGRGPLHERFLLSVEATAIALEERNYISPD